MKYIFVFYYGMVLGNFFSTCVDRIPQEKSILYPNYCCNNCNSKLKYYNLIPLLSFFNLRGKCKNCNKNIGIQHVIIKILTGIMFVVLLKYFNFSLNFIKYGLLFSILMVSSFIDYNTQYVFFNVSIIGIVSGVLFFILDILNGKEILSMFLKVIIPLFLIYGIMFIVKKIKKIDGIGYGDLEIFLILSLYLELRVVFLSMYLSILLVSCVAIIKYIKKNRQQYVAFVPYMSIATFVSVIFYEDIINYYLSLLTF